LFAGIPALKYPEVKFASNLAQLDQLFDFESHGMVMLISGMLYVALSFSKGSRHL
jgi:hypothetical protein